MLSSKLGDSFALEQMISQGKIQLLPMSDIRGFDTSGMNAGIYITEAQNMDISLMKLALQRIGDDSICIIDGDYSAQVDLNQYAGNNNGMRRMSEVFRGQDFYGEVELQNIYRSKISQVAEGM
jgi:predicted ribonuclease YlaK